MWLLFGAAKQKPHSVVGVPGGTPRGGENRGWSPADVVLAWCRLRPSFSLTLGVVIGAPHCRFEHVSPHLAVPTDSPGGRCVPAGEAEVIMEEVAESAEIVARVAALDLGKSSLVACVRVPCPDKPG